MSTSTQGTAVPRLPIALLFLCAFTLEAPAQTATIHHYGGTALPPGTASDTAFCKGQSHIEIHGADFMAAPTPWLWDSIHIHLGSLRLGFSYLVNSEIHTAIPDSFPNDTCLLLRITQFVHAGSTAFSFTAGDTVCLVGDHTVISYRASPWCLGEGNPLPTLQSSPGTWPGVFCCPSNPSFIVQPSGEVILHSGAIGSGTWAYQSSRPVCGDTHSFSAVVLPQTQARATIRGAVSLTQCQSDPVLRADAADPPGGRYTCGDAGLAILDDSLGVFSLRQSRAGYYVITYTPPGACVGAAVVNLGIQPSPGADLEVGVACGGLPVPATAISQGLGGVVAFNWSLNDSGFVAGSGWDQHEFASLRDGDSLRVVVENTLGCTDTAGMRVHVRPRPRLGLPHLGAVAGMPVWRVGSNMDSTVLHWDLAEELLGTAAKQGLAAGLAFVGSSAEDVEIAPSGILPGHVPGNFSLLCLKVHGEADGCPSDTLQDCAQYLPGAGIFVPEAMTPNGDGINDVWELRWPEGLDAGAYSMQVFNRSGGRVLHMQGLQQGWDGGTLPDGVYWWVLDVGGKCVDKGGLTIRRK